MILLCNLLNTFFSAFFAATIAWCTFNAVEHLQNNCPALAYNRITKEMIPISNEINSDFAPMLEQSQMKSISCVYDKLRHKPDCSATESSYNIENVVIRKIARILLFAGCYKGFIALSVATVYAINCFSHALATMYIMIKETPYRMALRSW